MSFKFCPKCGVSLEIKQMEGLGRLYCPSCKYVFYQNPKPTASAVIVDQDRVMLVKRAIEPQKGCWDLPGGFLEEDEHPEQALKREIKEELSISIEIKDFLGIFMDRYGYDQSGSYTLNIYYLARINAGEPKPASDIDQWGWFKRSEIPSNIAFTNNKEALQAWFDRIDDGGS